VFVVMLLSLAGAASLLWFKYVEVEMFPDVDFDYIYITVETPPGTQIEITDTIARQVEAVLQEHVPEAVQVVATVGQKGQSAYEFSAGLNEVITNFAEITIELLDGKEFVRASHHEVQDRIRPMLEAIPGAKIRFRPISWGPPTEAPVLVKVKGQDLDVLRGITTRITGLMADIQGIVDIEDDFSDAPPELKVAIDRPKAAALGVSMQAIAMSLRAATAGLDVRDFRDELDVSKKYDFKIIFAPQSRTSPNMLDSIKVRSDSGELIPLSTVVRVTQGEGMNSIRHADRRRIVRITANNRGRSAVEITNELIPILNNMTLPAGYSFDFSGEYEATQESFDSLKLAYVVAVLLILTLLVSQFNSIAQPFAILCALPLSVVGAMVGLWVTGNEFSIMSFIGLVGLCGIVVNDSIVLVDCVNRKRQEGMSMIDGIVNGGIQRIRPIISTTLSTMGGIFTLTITDKLWEGLGVVIIFGIASATVLTLVVVPVMYSVFEGMRYYIISAFRGPRWKEAPTGRSFFYSRGKGAMLVLSFVLIVQLVVLVAGVTYLAPGFEEAIRTTTLRATTVLKLGLEVGVFYATLALKAFGYFVILLIPTWIGLVFLMAKRSREGYYVDIIPGGMTVGSPVDRFFVKNEEIRKVRRGFLFPSSQLVVYAGRRKLILRKLIEAKRTPGKKPLFKWLGEPSPSRKHVRTSMQELKKALEAQVN
jgi:multidrug efflux pump subunit AcrB